MVHVTGAIRHIIGALVVALQPSSFGAQFSTKQEHSAFCLLKRGIKLCSLL